MSCRRTARGGVPSEGCPPARTTEPLQHMHLERKVLSTQARQAPSPTPLQTPVPVLVVVAAEEAAAGSPVPADVVAGDAVAGRVSSKHASIRGMDKSLLRSACSCGSANEPPVQGDASAIASPAAQTKGLEVTDSSRAKGMDYFCFTDKATARRYQQCACR